MRALTISIVVAMAGAAHAGTRIVVMTDPDDAAALQVALAGRGAEVAPLPEPEGALRFDRAAAAQRTAVAQQATAAVWIEQDPGTAEVCVVSADGRVLRNAPLPIDVGSPRVFAAIAVSLLDELLTPPIEVHVELAPMPAVTPAPASRPTPTTLFESSAVEVRAAAPAVTRRPPMFMVDVGPYFASRGMKFNYDLATNSPPPSYPASGINGIQIGAAVFPLPRDARGMSGPGLSFSMSHSVSASLTAMDDTGYADYTVDDTAWDVGLHYRYRSDLFAFDGSVAIGNVATSIIDLPASIELPDTSYKYVAAGLHVDLDVAPGASIGFGARYLGVMTSGDITSIDWYGPASAYGYALDAGFIVPILGPIYGRGSLTYRSEHLDFEGDGAVTRAHSVWSADDTTIVGSANLGVKF